MPDPPSPVPLGGAAPRRAADDELASTIVTATLEEEHRPRTNLLWCASFQLAWNALRARVGGELALAGAPPLGEALGRGTGAHFALDPASFVAAAGFAEDGVLEAVRAELRAKFGVAAGAELAPGAIEPGGALLYAFLRKSLSFATPLCAAQAPRLLFRGTPVRSFGLWQDGSPREKWRQRARQIAVLDHRANEDFVVEIATSEPDDRLLVACVPPAATLEGTVRAVLARADAGLSWWQRLRRQGELGPEEELCVPSMNFQVTRVYREIAGRKIESPAFSDHFIGDARQLIALRLDERGAVLRSEAAGVVLPAPARRERKLWCASPFLVLLARRGAASPYFAAWIETSELLQPVALDMPRA
ncbi:MAG: hypothetical protein HY744_06755 [Deltaproteobacteria bacterium]|nr:hypothetical protein [Deltaproteobacteria bacterium]